MKNISKYVFITVLLAILLIFVLQKNNSNAQRVTENIVDQTSKIVHLPFEDMTIPYLRNKSYDGNLNEKTVFNKYPAYTSYLTSYSSDDLKINALLTIPNGQKPDKGWPAIVFVHGYIPPAQYKTTSNYVAYVDTLANSGFVVLKIDLRGHGDSEGEARGGYFTSDYVIDILNAYNALQKTDFVDPSKIGLWGHSMAGNSVLRAVAVKRDIPAVVIWAGAVYTYKDMLDYGISDRSYVPRDPNSPGGKRRSELYSIHGQFSFESPFWKQVVPTNYLYDVTTAIQLNHAKDDDVVNIGYSRDLMAILDKTKLEHELNEYEFGGHNISGSAFTRSMDNTIRFFNQYFVEKSD